MSFKAITLESIWIEDLCTDEGEDEMVPGKNNLFKYGWLV